MQFLDLHAVDWCFISQSASLLVRNVGQVVSPLVAPSTHVADVVPRQRAISHVVHDVEVAHLVIPSASVSWRVFQIWIKREVQYMNCGLQGNFSIW